MLSFVDDQKLRGKFFNELYKIGYRYLYKKGGKLHALTLHPMFGEEEIYKTSMLIDNTGEWLPYLLEGWTLKLERKSEDEATLKNEGENMEKLSTIQKRENLNEVYAVGEKGNGGAHHIYTVYSTKHPNGTPPYLTILFQNGARKLPESVHGVLDTDLLEIVRHRLQCFQEGEFKTRENAIALTHIEEALLWMNKRVEDRIERSVLGTNQK